MPNNYKDDLEALNDYEEIFHYLENLLKEYVDSDGLTITVHEKSDDHFLLLTDDLQWREMDILPESLIKTTFETTVPQIVSDHKENPLFNLSLDCAGQEDTSAILLYPITGENGEVDLVLSLRKSFKKEKDEVMEPLIVGSQMMGVTTRVKNTLIPRFFKEEDITTIQEHEEALFATIKKLTAQIKTQKMAVLNQISQNEQVFNTPQEIITTLVNILMGTNTSIQNLQDTLIQIKEKTHHNDKIIPHITLMEETLDKLEKNLLSAFRFSTTNNVIQELFKDKEVINTKDFFEYFGTFGQDIVCKRDLFLNFFLDPKLPSKIKLEKQNTHIFLTELLRFSFNDAKSHTHFNIQISKNKDATSSLFRITYHTDIDDPQLYRNMFISDQSDQLLEKSIHISYKKFIQTGGKISINADKEQHKITFKITIPFENESSEVLANTLTKENAKIGLLLDKEKDFQSANNIAKYLLSLGIKQSQVRGSENLKLFKDDLTHLIIFQSKFSKELFDVSLKNKPYNIMLITDGCPKNEEVTFYDYSMVDYEIDRNRFYLYDLEDFIRMETE